jgi:hypothetical protein
MYCAANDNKTAQICGGSSVFGMYFSKDVITPTKRWLGNHYWRSRMRRMLKDSEGA